MSARRAKEEFFEDLWDSLGCLLQFAFWIGLVLLLTWASKR